MEAHKLLELLTAAIIEGHRDEARLRPVHIRGVVLHEGRQDVEVGGSYDIDEFDDPIVIDLRAEYE